MLSQETTAHLKANNYTFEQINGISLWLEQSGKWQVLSQSEMDVFIDTELIAQFSAHA